MAQPTNQGQENTEKQFEQFNLKYLINHLALITCDLSNHHLQTLSIVN